MFCPDKFYEDLKSRFDAGAKTLVMDREETEIVLKLLQAKKKIEKGAALASKYINRELNR